MSNDIFQVLRDLVSAVEIAEENDYSESSRQVLAAAAERASEVVYLHRMARRACKANAARVAGNSGKPSGARKDSVYPRLSLLICSIAHRSMEHENPLSH